MEGMHIGRGQCGPKVRSGCVGVYLACSEQQYQADEERKARLIDLLKEQENARSQANIDTLKHLHDERVPPLGAS